MSLIRISRSHLVSLTYPKSQTSDRRDSWKNVVRTFKKNRSLDGATIQILYCLKCYEHFTFLYLGNKLRYRDESKRDFNGVIYCIFWMDFDEKIFDICSRFWREKLMKFHSFIWHFNDYNSWLPWFKVSSHQVVFFSNAVNSVCPRLRFLWKKLFIREKFYSIKTFISSRRENLIRMLNNL